MYTYKNSYLVTSPINIDKYYEVYLFVGDGEDDIQEINKKLELYNKPYMIYPTGTFYNIWNLIIMIILTWLAFYLPITVAIVTLEVEYTAFNYVNLFINVMFIVDIIINFNTAFLDDYGQMEERRCYICKNYLMSWFAIDFVSSIPINEFTYFYYGNAQGGNIGRIGKYLRLLKYWRLIKIMRMSKVINSLKKSENYKNLVNSYGETFNWLQKLFKSSTILIFACHLLVCFYISIAQDKIAQNEENWWTSYTGGDTTLMEDWEAIFVTCWYWAVQTVTTVGYGDIPSIGIQERIFRMFAMVIGVGIFGEFMSNLASYGGSDKDLMESDLMKIEEKLDTIKVKYNLRGRSILNLEYLMAKLGERYLEHDYKFINKLPFAKSRQVFGNIKSNMQGYVRLFRELELECFIEIFRNLIKQHYGEQDVIHQNEQKHFGLLMIDKGFISLVDKQLLKYRITTNGAYKVLTLGESFGFSDLIYHPTCTVNIVSLEQSEIFEIKHRKILKIIQKYEMIQLIERLAEKETKKVYKNKFAILIILVFLRALGVHVRQFDILDMKMRLFKDKNYFMDLFKISSTRHIAKRAKWYHNILSNSFDHWIRHNTNETLKKLKSNFDNKLKILYKKLRQNQDGNKFSDELAKILSTALDDENQINDEGTMNSMRSNMSFNSNYQDFIEEDYISTLVKITNEEGVNNMVTTKTRKQSNTFKKYNSMIGDEIPEIPDLKVSPMNQSLKKNDRDKVKISKDALKMIGNDRINFRSIQNELVD